jgi:protease II
MIHDEEQIKQYVRLLICDGKIHQIFLAQRSKYQSDEAKLLDKITRPHLQTYTFPLKSEEQYVDKVKSFMSLWKDQKTMVLYSTTNERSPKKALKGFMDEVMRHAFDDQDFSKFLPENLHSFYMASCGHKRWISIDIDDKIQFEPVIASLNELGMTYTIVETRGGYHILIDSNIEANKKKLEFVYKQFSKIHYMGDIMCPIPGTYQGGFPVRFVNK